jgi:hypothetical protein
MEVKNRARPHTKEDEEIRIVGGKCWKVMNDG